MGEKTSATQDSSKIKAEDRKGAMHSDVVVYTSFGFAIVVALPATFTRVLLPMVTRRPA